MSNRDDTMAEDLAFENQLNELGDNQLGLIKFAVRQIHSTNLIVSGHTGQLKKLESAGTRAIQIGGAIGGSIGSVVIAGLYFLTGWLRK